MIYLTKGQTLYDNPAMVVYDQTGYYEDGASVICAASYAPEDPVCRYEAKYIAYGNMVYTISEPTKLTEEILAIDPKSLFGKTNQDVVLDAVVENIQTVTPDTGNSPSTPQIPSEQSTSTPITTPAEVESALTASSTPPLADIPSEPVLSTTTTPTLIDEAVSIVEPIEQTPPLSPIIENISTTTPPLTEITF